MKLVIEFSPTVKQSIALKYLFDKKTKIIGYGGSAGSGKTTLGSVWIISMCLKYPGTRYLVGRGKLKTLKQSTLLTIFETLHEWGLKPNQHYFYNSVEGTIKFINKSSIYLKDLFAYPSDPEFDSLGSTEFTSGWIDEASEVTEKAKNIVLSRLRYKIKDYDLMPKLLVTSNPCKHWLYRDLYKPWVKKELEKIFVFIPALPTDNPHLPKEYIENLKLLDSASRERLLHGNWEWDDDPAKLCEYDAIMDTFTNDHIKPTGNKYCSSDLAMQGRDKFVTLVADGDKKNGLHIKFPIIKDKAEGKEIELDLKATLESKGIGRSRTVTDHDGMGAYLESYIRGIKKFHGGAKAYKSHIFNNLKTECGFKLAEFINKRKMFLDIPKDQMITVKGKRKNLRETISEELQQLKRDKMDKDDSKIMLMKKETIKENIGRSPDFLDTLMMLMIFFLVNTKIVVLKDEKGLVF